MPEKRHRQIAEDQRSANTPIELGTKCSFPRCAQIRNNAGWSKSELAREAGVSVDLVRSIERGGMHMSHKVMKVLSALKSKVPSIEPDKELV